MQPTHTVDDFLQTIQRSGLLDRNHLTTYLQQLGGAAPPPEQPAVLAGLLVRDGMLTGYQVKQLLAGKWQRFTLLGKYKILGVIGAGGMGRVYLCAHVLLRRLVAIKVLPFTRSENPLAVERFYREARAVAALDHPNIVRCFDVDQDGMLHFMVMEYVDGANLDVIVKQNKQLDVTRAAHFMRQAARGLQHAHEAGWVHRDIKPANILLDRQGVVKLLDLGLARLFADQADNLTRMHDEHAVLGTADYIAPEQAMASHEVDIRADIYSLGATFYFLLTGQPPVPRGTVPQKLIWHQVRQPDPIRNTRPDVPPELEALVLRMLSKEPGQRPQVPAEVAEVLAPWTAEPLSPPSATDMPQYDPLVQQLAGLSPASSPQINLDTTGMTGSSVFRRILDSQPSGSLPGVSTSGLPGMSASGLPTPPSGQFAASVPTISVADSRVRQPSDRSTVVPNSDRSTKTPSKMVRVPPPPAPAPVQGRPPSKRRGWQAAPLLVAGVAVGGVVAWQVVGRKGETVAPTVPGPTQTTTPTVPTGRQPLVVTRNKNRPDFDKPNTVHTVQAALDRAQAGDRIVLMDQSYEERLVIDGVKRRLPRDITIESGVPKDQETVWGVPANSTDDLPLLTLSNVEGLRVKGITFDGKGGLDYLIALSGDCRSLRLEDLQLRGFSGKAILLNGCRGTLESPVEMLRLRTVTSSRNATGSALVFAARAGEDGFNQHLLLSDSRLEGPYLAAVRFEAPATAVELRRNRFYHATDGCRITKAALKAPLRLTLSGNTFCDLKVALHLEDAPAAGSELLMKNNLFAQTATLVVVDNEKSAEKVQGLFANAEGNFRDTESGTVGKALLQAVQRNVELSTDTADDHKFLRYPRGHALATAGTDGGPVGVPPE